MKQLLKESVQKVDFIIWILTILFFIWFAVFWQGNILNSFWWAIWIIILMFFVWLSIELILSALKNIKWLWEITGYITNWPEALVLIVWLISWNILFAASTPLGSNVVNPILLWFAILTVWMFGLIKNFRYKFFYISSFIFTAIIASTFFKIPEKFYFLWVLISVLFTIIFYIKNKRIITKEENLTIKKEEVQEKSPKYFLPLGIIILLAAWYFLDPVVSYTAEASKAPKWVIWFLVLSTLTSWPEFKSCISLLRKNRPLDAFVNILISNFTNIWLAAIWVLAWYLTNTF